MPNFLGIMGTSSFSSSSAAAIGLAAFLIFFTFFASNTTLIHAQQEGDQRVIRQPSTMEIITTAESTTDNFRLQVPQGWIIQDMNNTGAALVSETLEGFGILAQLCPEERQEVTPPNEDINISRGTSATISDNDSCRDTQQEVIHIVRYPNLGAKLGFDPEDIVTNEDITTDAILAYQMQKLQQVGYRDIRIIDSADTAINIDINTDLGGNDMIVATAPAKLVEMTYSTNLDPSETKTGYFISTTTAATPRNLGMVTGYGIFYEGTSSPPLPSSTNIAEEDGRDEPVQTDINSIVPPEPVREVFDTFELIARAEAVQAVEEGVVVEEGEELVDFLTVEVSTNGTEGEAPTTFVFEADAIGGTEPYTVTWDFDDDSVEETEEQTILHTFDEAGTYNVTVDVLDSEEETASDSIEITVEEEEEEDETDEESEGQEADQGEANGLPTVEIVSNDIEGEAPTTFELQANITGGTEPYTHSWDFGDGSEGSDEESVVHTYNEPGTYNVAVTITDSDDETASDNLEIIVEEEASAEEET